MTQPPDERDPSAGEPAQPGEPTPDAPGATGESPTQSWAPEPPPGVPPSDPESTVGWGALPPQPAAPAGQPPTSPLISAEPAAPAPAMAWATSAPQQEVAPGLVWADTPSRFVAYVIDSFLIGLVSTILVSLLGFRQVPLEAGQALDAESSIALSLITTAIGAGYFILSWSGGRRATLGQRLFNIQVGNAFDGRALTTNQAIKRWIGLGTFLSLLALIPNAFGAAALVQFVWAVVLLISTTSSPTKQGIHDRFANSAVVRPAGASNGLAMTCMIIVIALVLVGLASIVGLIFLGGQVSSILSSVGNSV